MDQVEYLTVAVQLKLLNEKKEIFKKELDKAIEERDIIFEQFTAHNAKREYISFVIGKTKEELSFCNQQKEELELSLAHLLTKRALRSQTTELLPADVDNDYFEEMEIRDKENDIMLIEKEIKSLHEKLTQEQNKLKEILVNKEILEKHREVCRQYQLAQKAYNDIVQDEIQTAQKFLSLYRNSKA